MTSWPLRVDAYKTSDGRVHMLCSAAEDWQGRLNSAVISNRLFYAGVSLGESLRFSGLLSGEVSARMPELDEITRDTRLIISHWQCRDMPGYQPIRVTASGGVFVHGDAGSWSGTYGEICAAHDVAKYWVDTKRRTARAIHQQGERQ